MFMAIRIRCTSCSRARDVSGRRQQRILEAGQGTMASAGEALCVKNHASGKQRTGLCHWRILLETRGCYLPDRRRGEADSLAAYSAEPVT